MGKEKLVKDLVLQYWNDMVKRRNKDLEASFQHAFQYELSPKKLYGWDLMDIVNSKHSRRRQLDFSTNWGPFAEECLVLLGQKLGDVIQPASDVLTCSRWNPITPKKIYLTATVASLEMLSYERGGDRDRLTSSRLTNKSYWHYKPRDLFSDCRACGQRKCRKRPQYLESSAKCGASSLIPPSEGAVVFGAHRNTLEKVLLANDTANRVDKESNGKQHRVTNGLSRLFFRNDGAASALEGRISTPLAHGTAMSLTASSSEESDCSVVSD